jgi:hypothetical protein
MLILVLDDFMAAALTPTAPTGSAHVVCAVGHNKVWMITTYFPDPN